MNARVDPSSDEHDWQYFELWRLTGCWKCGFVKRLDGKNKPCPGAVKVECREIVNERPR